MTVKNKSIGKNIIFKFVLNLFNIVVPILIGPYVTRTLGVGNMGEINFAQAIFSYFFIFASFGVYQYGLREISKYRDDKEKVSKVFTSLFSITMLTTIVSTIIYFIVIVNNYSGRDNYAASIILTFNLLSNVFYVEWINEAFENYDFITIKSIIVKVVYTICLFVMVKTSDNMKEYLYLLILSTFLNNFISYIYIRRRVKFNFKGLEIKKHLKPMIMVVILSNVNVLYTQLDRIMLGEYTTMEKVGFYGIGQNVSYMITGLILTIIYATIPRLTNYSSNNEDEYIRLLKKVSGVYFLFLFPACIGMMVLSREVISIYGGKEFVGAYMALALFSIYNITLGYESILNNQVLYVKGKEKFLVKIVLICGVFNLICNIILLNLNIFDESTAILTTMAANIIMIIVESVYIKKVMKIDFNIFNMQNTKYLIISMIFIPITYFIRYQFNNIILISLISILLCSGVYFGILLIIKDNVMNELLSFVIKSIKNKLKKGSA